MGMIVDNFKELLVSYYQALSQLTNIISNIYQQFQKNNLLVAPSIESLQFKLRLFFSKAILVSSEAQLAQGFEKLTALNKLLTKPNLTINELQKTLKPFALSIIYSQKNNSIGYRAPKAKPLSGVYEIKTRPIIAPDTLQLINQLKQGGASFTIEESIQSISACTELGSYSANLIISNN